jgi:hypothetical protein
VPSLFGQRKAINDLRAHHAVTHAVVLSARSSGTFRSAIVHSSADAAVGGQLTGRLGPALNSHGTTGGVSALFSGNARSSDAWDGTHMFFFF